MRIVIIGAGAVGSLYGGWLLAGGGDVAFVARGPRFDQLHVNGLSIRGARDLSLANLTVDRSTDDLPPADVLIFAVKLYDLKSAARAAVGALAADGLIVGLQNGVDSAEILGEVFGPAQVMAGPVYSAATLNADGSVRYGGLRNDLVIGSVGGKAHPHAHKLVEYWRKAGIDASISDDIQLTLWNKFLALATNAALTCLSRQSAGVVYRNPLLLDLARRSIAEIAAVGRAEGVRFSPDAEQEAMAFLQSLPPDVVASMRQDLDAGRRLELEGISGTVVRLGTKHGIATPVHDVAYACLKPFVDGS